MKAVSVPSWSRIRITVFLLVVALALWKNFFIRQQVQEDSQTWRRQEDILLSVSEEKKVTPDTLHSPPPPKYSPPPSPWDTSSDKKTSVTREIKTPSPPPPLVPTYPPPAPRERGKKGSTNEDKRRKKPGTTPVSTKSSEELEVSGNLRSGSCKIYVWDLANDLAPSIGMSGCNITDVWPFDHPGSGIEGMRRTAHQDAPHATGYWLVEAVKNSEHYEESMDKADLILVDTHCYESMYYAAQHATSKFDDGLDPINEISLDISRLFVEGVTSSLQFTRSKGKKFVLVRPSLGSPPGVMLDTCAKFKSSFFAASERGIFCDNDRDRAFLGKSIILPPVTNGYLSEANTPEMPPVEERDILFFLRIPCYEEPNQGDASPNIMLLQSIEKNIFKENLGGREDISIISKRETCKASPSERALSIRKMRSSRYCGILPASDRQSTIELPLAIQSGCIPVFLGPPFHSMPLISDVDYSKMAVFVNLVDHTKSMWKINDLKMQDGDLEPDERINKAPVEVPYLMDAIRHLQNIPATVAKELHEQVVTHMDTFSYQSNTIGAPDIAIKQMCKYSILMKEENERKARLRTPPPPPTKQM